MWADNQAGKRKRSNKSSQNHSDEQSQLEGSSQSGSPSKKNKLAPAEKITNPYRTAIIDAMLDPRYTKTLDFKSISSTESAKLSRHWREVLSTDMKMVMLGKGISGSPKGKIDSATRVKIWKMVCKGYDKLDWAAIIAKGEEQEEEQGRLDTTKLKRHFRDVMVKEGEKAIGK